MQMKAERQGQAHAWNCTTGDAPGCSPETHTVGSVSLLRTFAYEMNASALYSDEDDDG